MWLHSINMLIHNIKTNTFCLKRLVISYCFYKGLSAIDYDGVLSFETSPVLKSFPPELREDALRMIYKIGRYFGEKIETLH